MASGWTEIQAEAEGYVTRWQERLRLRDWRITTEVVRSYRMPSAVCGGIEAGHLERFRNTKQAEITICHPDDIHPDTPDMPASLEHTIVHELLHLHLDAWQPEPNTLEYWSMELAINTIADALLGGGNEG